MANTAPYPHKSSTSAYFRIFAFRYFNDIVAILKFLCRFSYDMQPLFCPRNDAPKNFLLPAIALGTSRTTSCTSAISTHTHGMQPNCDVKRIDAKHSTQHKLCCQFSAYPACWGAPAPKPPSPNILNQFSSSSFSRYNTAFSGCLLVFLTIRSTIFSPFCRFFYDITHIKYSKATNMPSFCPKNDNDNEKRYRKINTGGVPEHPVHTTYQPVLSPCIPRESS